MTFDELIDNFPLLFHMAECGSWQSIKQHGLLSTSALLDLFEIQGDRRRGIESSHRPESASISHEAYGIAVVRDQKPMSDAGLRRCLKDGLTPEEWYEILNSKTFFWTSVKRLHTLLNARPYKSKDHDVLTVETRSLVERCGDRILLSAMNSGCTTPFPHPRGLATFQPVGNYDFQEWRTKRKSKPWDAVVEVVVEGGVPDILGAVLRVDRMMGRHIKFNIWKDDGVCVSVPGEE